jgi:S1-C subfamily serine protease
MVTEKTKEEKKLAIDYGALIIKGDNNEPAITKDSAADKAGLKEGDIILYFGGKKVDSNNPLARLIQERRPKETVVLRILRDDREIELNLVLGERS